MRPTNPVIQRAACLGVGMSLAVLGMANAEQLHESPAPAPDAVALDGLPAQLPPAVERQLPKVDKVAAIVQQPNGKVWNETGSAVMLGPGVYLTAGHVVDATMPFQFLPDTGRSCQTERNSFTVDAPTRRPMEYVDATSIGKVVTTSGLGIAVNTASYNYVYTPPNTPEAKTDAALLFTRDTGGLTADDGVPIARQPAAIGQSVFFANFQPTPDGRRRDPAQTMLPPELSVAEQEQLIQPALYGGIVLKKISADGDMMVATNLHSYGAIPDKEGRPGSSGGPVMDSAGNLLGITVQSTVQPISLSTLRKEYGVNVRNVAQNALIDVVVVKSVTDQLVTSLVHKAFTAPLCGNLLRPESEAKGG